MNGITLSENFDQSAFLSFVAENNEMYIAYVSEQNLVIDYK